MSDSDLIRRGAAERAARQARTLRPAPGGGAGTVSRDARDVADEIAAAIRALPAVALEPEAAPRPNLDAVVDVVRRAESPSPPTCATCGDSGEGEEWDYSQEPPVLIPCPACAGGRRA